MEPCQEAYRQEEKSWRWMEVLWTRKTRKHLVCRALSWKSSVAIVTCLYGTCWKTGIHAQGMRHAADEGLNCL